MKLLHPFLHSPVVEPPTDLCRGSSTLLKFNVYSSFFRPTCYVAGLKWSSRWEWLERRHRLMAWKVHNCWKLLERDVDIVNNYWIAEQERRLSFIDDWRRCCCCCCSRLKWRREGAVSMSWPLLVECWGEELIIFPCVGRGLIVFP